MHSFPPPDEANAPIIFRLSMRDRQPVQMFGDEELCYFRVSREPWEDDIRSPEWSSPGDDPETWDGVSCNRSAFSLPTDVLWPDWPEHKVTQVEVARLSFSLPLPGQGKSQPPRLFQVHVRHDPVKASELLPDNYSHTLVVAVEGPIRCKIPHSIRRRIKQKIASLMNLACPSDSP